MAPRGRKRRAPAAAGQGGEGPERLRARAEGGPGGGGARVVIEHWWAVSEALREAVANLAVDINPEKPRRNSFEVSLVKEDGSTVELWSGIGKGPPRKLKFPDPAAMVEALKSSLA
uniref:Selenoprotein H n=1 Tax=Anser brachyrhynchus TaxID=132585 RepID=A0A8B9BM04_9AVES